MKMWISSVYGNRQGFHPADNYLKKFAGITKMWICLLVLATSAFASRTAITSLPYTISGSYTPADTFYLSGNLSSSSGTALVVSADNVKIDLNRDTLFFGTSGTDDAIGVRISGDNVKLFNGSVIHKPPHDTNSVIGIRAVSVSGANDTLYRVHALVTGYAYGTTTGNAVVYQTGSGTVGLLVDSCRILNMMTGYYQRSSYQACGLQWNKYMNNSLVDNPDTYYHMYICSTYVESPHAGVFFYGSEGPNPYGGVGWVKYSVFKERAQNRNYWSSAAGGYRYGEAYAIMSRGSSCLKIEHNLIYPDSSIMTPAGDTIFGGNGMFIERTNVTDSSYDGHGYPGHFSEIDSNIVYAGLGVAGGDHNTCIRVRHYTNHLKIYGNVLHTAADNSPSTPWRSSNSYGIWIGYDAFGNQDSVLVYNNTIYCETWAGGHGSAIELQGKAPEDFWEVRDNHLYSQGCFYEFSPSDGFENIVLHDDTLTEYGTMATNITFGNIYRASGTPDTGIIARDLVYGAGVYDTAIRFYNTYPTQSIRLQKTVNVRVTNNGIPVENAIVTAIDGYGHLQWADTTGSDGFAGKPTSYWYESANLPDSTNFNDFTITARFGSTAVQRAVVVTANLSGTMLDLTDTSGTTDTTPPGSVNDLGASTGSGEGRINLSWTSSGDDASSGTAMLYVIKYSISDITDANFESVSGSMANLPSPEVAGSAQSAVLTNLSPNTKYYVAMKVYDDMMNESSLSNVASAISSYSLPAGDTTGIDTTGTTSADTVVTEFIPTDGSTVKSSHPVLSARNIAGAEPNSYYFEVAENASFNPILTSSSGVPQSSQSHTVWEVDSALTPDHSYYWRVKVNDYPYSDAVQFSVGTSTEYIAYPNPVSFVRGQSVTFVLPAGPVDLFIQTPSGESVLHPTDLSGQFIWGGKNTSGNQVAVGVYLWYIEGTSYKGKIVVVP